MLKQGLQLAIIISLVCGVALFSGCRRNSPAYKAEFMVDYVSETLDLTETQQDKLNDIKDELLEKGLQMRANHKVLHDEIMLQLRSDQIDQAALKKAVAEQRTQMEGLINLMIERLAEFHQMLSADQRAKLVAKLETLEKWHSHGWE